MAATATRTFANRSSLTQPASSVRSEPVGRSLENSVTPVLPVPVEEASAVERRFASFRDELQPKGELGLTLVRRAATLAVRMEKCSERDLATAADRVARAMAEAVIPNGADEATAARLRAEAGRLAAFDTSKEAAQARRYEAAAERGFFRALKELRELDRPAKVDEADVQAELFRRELGSILQMESLDAEFDAEFPDLAVPTPPHPLDSNLAALVSRSRNSAEVPIAIGKSR